MSVIHTCTSCRVHCASAHLLYISEIHTCTLRRWFISLSAGTPSFFSFLLEQSPLIKQGVLLKLSCFACQARICILREVRFQILCAVMPFVRLANLRFFSFPPIPTCQVALHQPRGFVKWACFPLLLMQRMRSKRVCACIFWTGVSPFAFSFPNVQAVINYVMPAKLVEYVTASIVPYQ